MATKHSWDVTRCKIYMRSEIVALLKLHVNDDDDAGAASRSAMTGRGVRTADCPSRWKKAKRSNIAGVFTKDREEARARRDSIVRDSTGQGTGA